MTSTDVILIVFVWLAFGFWAAGYCWAYFTEKYAELEPSRSLVFLTLYLWMIGPLAFAVLWIKTGWQYGWKIPLVGK